jgi:hypothetical protein
MHRATFAFLLGILLGIPALGQNYTTVTATDRVQFVSINGKDSNDGLSTRTAKATLSAAYSVISAQGAGRIYMSGTGYRGSSAVTITTPLDLYLPCGTLSWSSQFLNVQSDDVHIHTCGNGSTGQINQYAASNSATQVIFTGTDSTTNLIQVRKAGARSTVSTARISGFSLEPLYINMQGYGNMALYLSSCWHCTIGAISVNNANCSDGAVDQEADPSSDGTLDAGSYYVKMDRPYVQVASGNSACHAFLFDATHGEIGYGNYDGLWASGYPDSTGSGSDQIFIASGSSLGDSFDQSLFVNPKTSDPVSGAMGIRLESTGNVLGGSGGRIFNVTFIDPQPERIRTSKSGTGIGCTASGADNGTGCGIIQIVDGSPNGWAANYGALGVGSSLLGDGLSRRLVSQPAFTTLPVGPATTSANQSGGSINFLSNYWNGSASAQDVWTCAPHLGSGTNPSSFLTCSHIAGTSGSAGFAVVGSGGLSLVRPGYGAVALVYPSGITDHPTLTLPDVSGTVAAVGGTPSASQLVCFISTSPLELGHCTTKPRGKPPTCNCQ